MAYKCEICGKKPVAGKSYSHSHKATKRLFKPNLQKQKVALDGSTKSAYVCTVCIKSGKAVRRKAGGRAFLPEIGDSNLFPGKSGCCP